MRRVKLLFVCIGNAHRSQMAEGFARHLGADFVDVQSAGLAPVAYVPEVTRRVMQEKGVSLETHFPKALEELPLEGVDLAVNMSGARLYGLPVGRVVDWKVKDPVGQSEDVHREVRDDIEQRVAELIEELRSAQARI
jgi:arsenate reductase